MNKQAVRRWLDSSCYFRFGYSAWLEEHAIVLTNLKWDVVMAESEGVNYFLCIGAQKSGTTWLYKSLLAHPEIALPPIKELHFFDDIQENRNLLTRLLSSHALDKRWRREFINSLGNFFNDRGKHLWTFKFLFLKRKSRNIYLYRRLLTELGDSTVGEITPAYQTISIDLIREIKRVFPLLKVIFILRDPVEREWAQARMDFLGNESQVIDEETYKQIEVFLRKRNPRSEYLDTLNSWKMHFPSEQLLVLFYDELLENQLGLLNKVVRFLGATEFAKLPIQGRVNTGVDIEIPLRFQRILCEKYGATTVELKKKFKGKDADYISKWLLRMIEKLSV